MQESEKLMQARCRLMTREPWYGHVAMSMKWTPHEMPWKPVEARTMGVRIMHSGEVECIYYPPFVESMTLKECFAVIQHEIEHIVRCHCLRVGSRNPEAWNIAADMTVNGHKSSPRIGYRESNQQVIVPLEGQIVWIPDNWERDESSEHYYARLLKEQEGMGKTCKDCGRPVPEGQGKGQGKGKGDEEQEGEGGSQGEGQEEGQGEGGEGQGEGCGCPTCGQAAGQYSYGGVQGKMIDDHEVWSQTEVSEDEMRQVVKSITDEATAKNKGEAPGHLQEALDALGKPKVRWRELLRQYFGRHLGNQRKTYARRNRRHNRFGVKGTSRHAAATVNVIIDTSGSVGAKELEQFFAEIDTISGQAKVNVLQWDHAFQGWGPYRHNDWKKFKVNGRGGTDMAAPIQWLMDNKVVADCQVMLTDGYCNWHEPEGFPMITCITTPADNTQDCPWGHTVRIDCS